MVLVRAILAVIGVFFAGLIVWAVRDGDFWAEGTWLTRNPWGIVSLSDLYIGFMVTAILMFLLEAPRARWFWIVPLPFLGNVWTIIWLVWRLPALYVLARHKALE